MEDLFWLQSCSVQDVESSHKFYRFLTITRSAPHAIFSLKHTDAPSLSKGGVLLGPQVSARSLEAIVFIIAKSIWRIAPSCMHAGMQIRTNEVTCTLPSTDRLKPTRCTLPTLYSKRPSAAITPTARQIAHSTRWDNAGSQFLQLQTGCSVLH